MISKSTLADLKLESDDTKVKLYVPFCGLTRCKPENVAVPALEVVSTREPVLGYSEVSVYTVSTDVLAIVVAFAPSMNG